MLAGCSAALFVSSPRRPPLLARLPKRLPSNCLRATLETLLAGRLRPRALDSREEMVLVIAAWIWLLSLTTCMGRCCWGSCCGRCCCCWCHVIRDSCLLWHVLVCPGLVRHINTHPCLRNDDGLRRLLAIGVWVAVNRALSPIDHLAAGVIDNCIEAREGVASRISDVSGLCVSLQCRC